MSFISVFDVLGPNMVGPSSSHTAGAAAIANVAHKLLAPPLKKVEFTLYGSFARTYHGHGTDRALLGGILGFATDDPCLASHPEECQIAKPPVPQQRQSAGIFSHISALPVS